MQILVRSCSWTPYSKSLFYNNSITRIPISIDCYITKLSCINYNKRIRNYMIHNFQINSHWLSILKGIIKASSRSSLNISNYKKERVENGPRKNPRGKWTRGKINNPPCQTSKINNYKQKVSQTLNSHFTSKVGTNPSLETRRTPPPLLPWKFSLLRVQYLQFNPLPTTPHSLFSPVATPRVGNWKSFLSALRRPMSRNRHLPGTPYRLTYANPHASMLFPVSWIRFASWSSANPTYRA